MTDDRMYTLADGREFPWNSELPRIEREVIALHVANLRGRDLAMRQRYLEDVKRSEGQASHDKVAAAYDDDWKARKAAADEAKARSERAKA